MSSLDGLYKFEQVCEAFIDADQERQKRALEILDEGERETFLMGVALYRLFTRPDYYKEMKQAMAEKMYYEFREGK